MPATDFTDFTDIYRLLFREISAICGLILLRSFSMRTLFRREDQEVVVLEEIVFFGQLESAGLQFSDDFLLSKLHFGGRSNRQLLLFIIDDDDLTSRLQHSFHLRRVRESVLNVMPRIADEKAVDGCICEQRIIREPKGWS